jgi:hypothetical protein
MTRKVLEVLRCVQFKCSNILAFESPSSQGTLNLCINVGKLSKEEAEVVEINVFLWVFTMKADTAFLALES